MAGPLPPLPLYKLKFLEKYGGEKGERIVAAVAAIQVAYPLVKWGWDRAHRKEWYTITIAGTDEIYPDLHEWVLERIPEDERKAMIACTTERFHQDTENKVPPVRLRYDGSRTQDVVIDGCKVWVTVEREETGGSNSLLGSRDKISEQFRSLFESIKFTAESIAGRDAIVKMIDGLVQEKYNRPGPPPLWVPSRWGGSWNKRSDLPARTLESVILKGGQTEKLIADLTTFLSSEEIYARMSQPWHRGYLFHGIPGTGKTSVARALANHFDMPLFYLPLGDLEKDADLMSLVGAISARSILLLEDIDVYHAARDRDDDDNTTVAGMLNALDGVWTPHGLITIMTTNNRHKLDDALIRPGRIDVDMEFTGLDHNQAARLSRYICGESSGVVNDAFVGKSPAELIQALRESEESDVATTPSGCVAGLAA